MFIFTFVCCFCLLSILPSDSRIYKFLFGNYLSFFCFIYFELSQTILTTHPTPQGTPTPEDSSMAKPDLMPEFLELFGKEACHWGC